MTQPTPSTALAQLSPRAARWTLLITAAVTTLLVAVSISPHAIDFTKKRTALPGTADFDLYKAEAQRIAAGESYYQAASAELHARHYPTRSVFNWRTPLPMWLAGKLHDPWAGRLIIGALAALVVALALHIVAREGTTRRAMLCGALLIGGLMPAWLVDVHLMPVVWSGVLIALSVCAYANEWRVWGFAFGLAAVFVREIAGLYPVVCLLLAARERRWRETAAWVAGIAAYFAFYAWHAMQVRALMGPNEPAHTQGWLQMGGAAFIIAMAQINVFLLLLPQWVTAIYVPLAMLGFAAWRSPTGLRAGATVCAFVLLFSFFGQPFNQYWGALITPLLCFGAAQAPAALVDLVRRARAIPSTAPALAPVNL